MIKRLEKLTLFPEEGPTLRGDVCTEVMRGLSELQEQAEYLLQVVQTDGFYLHPKAKQIQALIHMSGRFLSAAKQMCLEECDPSPEALTEEESRLSQQIFLVPQEEVSRVADEVALAFDTLIDPKDGKKG